MSQDLIRTLLFLLSRLERISPDSVLAHRASGIRGAMLRMVETLEKDKAGSNTEVEKLIENGYSVLEKAAEEKVR
ncbi:MAG: hypothetical protein L6Q49_08625 [Anaerolineales bacterium]|nr:hypothetical protein [Anaerolineales bacterium]